MDKFEKPKDMSDNQWNFRKLELELGEKEANNVVANRLRQLADIVESKDYPKVFGFKDESAGFLNVYEIVLSHPWPG